jgi:hypothetical protein
MSRGLCLLTSAEVIEGREPSRALIAVLSSVGGFLLLSQLSLTVPTIGWATSANRASRRHRG